MSFEAQMVPQKKVKEAYRSVFRGSDIRRGNLTAARPVRDVQI